MATAQTVTVSRETSEQITAHMRQLARENYQLKLKCRELAARNIALWNRIRELEQQQCAVS